MYFWIPGCEPPPLEPHSEAKHELFRAYVNAYLNRLTLRREQERLRLTIIDGFCGGGSYRGTNGLLVPGSPMIFLQEVARAEEVLKSQRRKEFKLAIDYYFIDESKEHCAYLREEIKRSPYVDLLDKQVQIIASPFTAVYGQIIREVSGRAGKRRALFFIDQYGYADAPLDVIRKILVGIDGAEVILTFAIDALINYLSESDRFAKAVEPVELSRERILELKRLWEQSESGSRYVIQNALFDHVARSTGAPYSSPFFVRSHASKRAYWLVHLSKHHTARDVMGEIHWRIQNSSLHHGREGLISLGFDGAFHEPSLPFEFDADARRRSIARVEAEAPNLIYDAAGHAGGSIRYEDFYARLCSHTPVTREMLDTVLARIRQEGDLKVIAPNGLPKRGTKFDWNDRLAKPDKPGLFTIWNPLLREASTTRAGIQGGLARGVSAGTRGDDAPVPAPLRRHQT